MLKKYFLRSVRIFAGLNFLFLAFTQNSWAYPEMVRHGYANCTSCHVSPNGGGVLTPYGRQLSKDVLSTWGTEQETRFVDLVTTPENLNLGGDVRALQLYQNTPTYTSGRLFLMQADAEAAYTFKKLTFDFSLGYNEQGSPQTALDHVISRRHYLLYQLTDELSVRAGKFLYSYGINDPNHEIFTKAGIQIGDESVPGSAETYNLEFAWLTESVNVYATGIFGRPDSTSLHREKGMSLTGSIAPGQTYKTGVSYHYGYTDVGTNRHVVGPWGILGFTPKFFLLSEFDFQGTHSDSNASQSRVWGFVDYQRLDYEYFQGFHGFLTQQLLRSDFKSAASLTKAYGIGLQWFPRPHFDFELEWQIQINASVPGYSDYAYAMMHLYL